MKQFLQSEATECGLACLAMVASYHDPGVNLTSLRRNHGASLKGTTIRQLTEIAARMQFKARAIRVDLEDLDKLQTPCILHWDMNHFVVLDKVGRKRISIVDPATGKRKVTYAEASAHFTGVVLELEPSATFTRTPPSPAVSLRELTGPIGGLKRSLAQLFGLSLALQVFVLVTPFFLQWIVDQVLVSADRSLLTLLGIGFLILLCLQTAISLLRGWVVVYLSARFGLQWTGNVFSHLLRLPLDYFEKRHLGDVTSRIGSVQAIQRTLTTSFVESVIDGFMVVVTLGIMLAYSWKLALVTLLAVAVYVGLRAALYRPIREGTEKQLMASANQQSHLLESIRGMQSVKVSGKEGSRRSGYFNLMNETVNRDVSLAVFNLGFATSSQLVFGVERIIVIWIGALLALENTFSAGMLIAYIAYKDQFATRASGLIDKWIEFRMLRVHGERLADIVLTDAEKNDGRELPVDARASIELSSISFRYATDEPWVIHNCSFNISEGESVAVTGPSGCGKSTLLKLMLGLLHPDEGVIRVGGIDLAKMSPTSFRDQASAVMQDDQLFAGSVAENIAFGDETVNYSEVELAARLAAIHDDIIAMPMGYRTHIGDMGTVLSGGQKQRVLLARALYRKPRFLFLDEATSHLDVNRERLVNESVLSLPLTRVIVAHRPETIESADRVIVIENGSVVQEYTPLKGQSQRAVALRAGKNEIPA